MNERLLLKVSCVLALLVCASGCNESVPICDTAVNCSTDDPNATAMCRDNVCTVVCHEGFLDVDGVCTAVMCEPGSAVCNDTGDGLKVCKTDGLGYEDQPCTTDDPNATVSCSDNACKTTCNAGFVDVGGVCQSVSCTPNDKICSGDKVYACNAHGLVYEVAETCTTTRENAHGVCVNLACTDACDNGFVDVGGVCTAMICTPGSTVCNDTGDGLKVCKADGTGYEDQPCTTSDPNATVSCSENACKVACNDGFVDVGGVCQSVSCTLGDKICSGDKVYACHANGLGYEVVETCTTMRENAYAVCVDLTCTDACDNGFVDVGGVCTAIICTPGLAVCNDTDDGLKVCKADGTGYEDQPCTTADPNATVTCSENACKVACNAGFVDVGGVCQSVSCTPNDKICSGDKVYACNAHGLVYEVAETCTTTRENAHGVCVNLACTDACDNGFVDVGGVCTAIICTPGSAVCNDTDDGLKVCKADGTGYENQPCTTADPNATVTCSDNACKTTCNDGFLSVSGICQSVSCKPGDKICGADNVYACNANGLGYEVAETCTTTRENAYGVCVDSACTDACNAGFVDVDGVCTAMICTPGTAVCNDAGDGLKICNANGLGYEVGKTCTPTRENARGVCVDSACTDVCNAGFVDVDGVRCEKFVDDIVKNYALANWDTNKDGSISRNEADAVTELKTYAFRNSGVTTLEDLNLFKNLTKLNTYSINDESNITSLTLLNVTTVDMYFVDDSTALEVLQLPKLNEILDTYPFLFNPKLHTVVMTSPGDILTPDSKIIFWGGSDGKCYNPANVTLYLNKDKLTQSPTITAPNQWAHQTWKAIYICDDYALKDDPSCTLVE